MTAALALADDATGALETGARMSEAGLAARVRFVSDLAGRGGARVIDTETRHLPAEPARARIHEIAARAKREGIAHIFKKTDSTLRGPIGAEFRALLEVWPERPLVYAPAYPGLGRTVRNGELFVDGRRLCETAFAADALNPSRESSIAALLEGSGAEVVSVRSGAELPGALAGGRIVVCDGETDADLAAVADAMRGTPCVVAGTAAMASAWAAALSGGARHVWTPPAAMRTGLVINGSLHPASCEQVAASGLATMAHRPAADAREAGRQLAALVAGERWAALCASPPCAADPAAVARHAARVAAEAMGAAAPDCLVVFGGDTVFAILRELGIDEAMPRAEILPGVPASTIGGVLLVTKAGGFGTRDYLARIRRILEKA